MKKKILTDIIVTVLSVVFIIIGYLVVPFEYSPDSGMKTEKATVLEILDIKKDSYNIGSDITVTNITFKGRFTSGENKGKTFTGTQKIDEIIKPLPSQVTKGDHILCVQTQSEDTQETQWVFDGFNRFSKIVWLLVFFFALIIFIGRYKGLSTLVSLVLTIGIIFIVYLPSILFGKNIYISTVIVSVYIILMSLILINGINKKTFCAIAGNIGGLLIAGILCIIMNNILDITGFLDQNYTFLSMLDNGVSIDLRAVVWGSVVIGALGAVMDIAMSISSSMKELSDTMKDRTYANMVRSGMNIGRDAIGTMTNTLILAYIGSSLAVILLFIAYSKDLRYILNLEVIVVEIMQAVVGSIGILFAVPATVLLSAKVYCKKEKNK